METRFARQPMGHSQTCMFDAMYSNGAQGGTQKFQFCVVVSCLCRSQESGRVKKQSQDLAIHGVANLQPMAPASSAAVCTPAWMSKETRTGSKEKLCLVHTCHHVPICTIMIHYVPIWSYREKRFPACRAKMAWQRNPKCKVAPQVAKVIHGYQWALLRPRLSAREQRECQFKTECAACTVDSPC